MPAPRAEPAPRAVPVPSARSGELPVPLGPNETIFYVQFDWRGDIPSSQALQGTLRYPSDLNFHLGEAKIVYEWRPPDGKETTPNPRTGQLWGPIWKKNVAEQLLPDNMSRHLATMDAWLGTFVPRDFDGIVCIDFEAWTIREDSHHALPGQGELNARLFPGKSQAELMREFVRATEREARRLRPRVRAWGWFGLGGMHPMFPYWNPKDYEQAKLDELRWAEWLKDIQAPMPFFYPHTSLPMAQRAAMQRETGESWKRLYGRDHLVNDGYVYVTALASEPRPGGGSQAITPEEFRICVDAAREIGMRRFIVWAALDSAQTRDELQQFIDNTLAPLMREWNAK